MSADLVSVSLGVHGTVFAASLVAIWKLGGESKFGTEKIADLHTLRPKVLKATVDELEAHLNPVLVAGENIVPIEKDKDNNPMPKPARLNVDGKDALRDAVRNFVKAKSIALVDLCQLNKLDDRLTACMRWLRHIVSALAIVTIMFSGLMGTAKFDWTAMNVQWIHVAGFSLVGLLILSSLLLFFSILNTSSEVDLLKSRYVDLPN